MKEILILMSTYNGEKYLNEQLTSLFQQKRVKVTVLVRDDDSSDNTKNILEQWKDKVDLNWYTGEHLNAEFSFFDLMEHAAKMDFQYFAFCDQDDVWDQDKLYCALKKLEQIEPNKEALYCCGQKLVNEKLELISVHKLNKNRNLYARFMYNDAAGCTEVFNQALLKRIVQYKPKYLSMHDSWLVKVCLATGGEIIVDPKAHISYRQHENNVLGLKRDFKSKLVRAKKYIDELDITSQMKELERGYSMYLIPEYREIVLDVLKYKKHFKNKIRLLNMRKFKYANIGITLTYIIKVLENKV